MLKKSLTIGCFVLSTNSCLTSEPKQVNIDIKWEMANSSYQLTTETTLNETNLLALKNILSDYNTIDIKFPLGEAKNFNTSALPETSPNTTKKSHADYLKSGDRFLLLLRRKEKAGEKSSLIAHQNSEIVGGAYVSYEDNRKTLCLLQESYKDLPFMELPYVRKMVANELSSSANFPGVQKLIIFSKPYNLHNLSLRIYGFSDCIYSHGDFLGEQYVCFEKGM